MAATRTTTTAGATAGPQHRSPRGRWSPARLRTTSVTVGGKRASYAIGGHGLPVLFLHGWGLDHRAYRRSLNRVTARGCRVIAPSMPGFGGSRSLPIGARSLESYADWVADFLDALEIDEPLLVVGHSLGGGVATKFAHDHPDRVRYLVLMNSVGATRPFGGTLADHIGALSGISAVGLVARAMSPSADGAAERMVHRVFVENFLRDPLAVTSAGLLALNADLADEIEALAARDVPALVLWSDRDSIIPLSAFDTFCSAFGAESEIVPGGHSWLLANPDAFGQVLDNVLHVQRREHEEQAATSSLTELREHLRPTTVPKRAVFQLLDAVSPLWAVSAPPQVLAADLTLCHPPLAADEVRAVARQVGPNTHRLTVVAHDRPGLLADTASVLANERIRVDAASAMTWSDENLALHSLRVYSATELTPERWAEIGERLRNVGSETTTTTLFLARGRAHVMRTGEGRQGTSVVRVSAPDQLGLLSAICRWFADHDVSVEAAKVATVDGVAEDLFLIRGECDIDALERRLSREPLCPLFEFGARMTRDMVRSAMQLGGFD